MCYSWFLFFYIIIFFLWVIRTQLTCNFNRRTAEPLGDYTHPGYYESTSRWQTAATMCTLNRHYPVIPSVTFIHWALWSSLSKSGSLYPAYAPVRLIGLTVKHAFRYYAIYFSFMRRLVSDQFLAVPLLLELI